VLNLVLNFFSGRNINSRDRIQYYATSVCTVLMQSLMRSSKQFYFGSFNPFYDDNDDGDDNNDNNHFLTYLLTNLLTCILTCLFTYLILNSQPFIAKVNFTLYD